MLTWRSLIRTCLAAAVVAAAAAVPARAQVTSYSSRAAYDAAVGPHPVVSFADGAPGAVLSGQYAGLGLLFPDGADLISSNSAFGDGFGAAGGGAEPAPPSPIEIHFLAPQTSVGADFPGALAIDLYAGQTPLGSSDNFGGNGAGHFGVVVSAVPFDRVVLRDPEDDRPFIDNLHYSTVPEPGGLALAAGSCLGCGFLVRRDGPCVRRSRRR